MVLPPLPKLEPLDGEPSSSNPRSKKSTVSMDRSLPNLYSFLSPDAIPKLESLEEHPEPSPSTEESFGPNPSLHLLSPDLPLDSIADILLAFHGAANKNKRLLPEPSPSAAASSSAAAKKKKPGARSADPVRVSRIDAVGRISARDEVRRTRILYESLKNHLIHHGEASPSPATLRSSARSTRRRPDLAAARMMRGAGLWLNRDRRIIGFIPGIDIGDVFFYQIELCVVGLHGLSQGGIDFVAGADPIATSVIISGGYEDDVDGGDVLVYTGQGGREARNTSKHSVDQKLERGNLALVSSCRHGIEVRVIRGLHSEKSPTGRVYVYDGLYKVEKYRTVYGKSGFLVYKFKLVRMEGQGEMGSAVMKLAEELKGNMGKARKGGYLSVDDLSNGKEKVPVSVFNDIDERGDPLDFGYQVRRALHPVALEERGDKGWRGGCRCVDGCSKNCACAKRNGGAFAYNESGVLLKGKPVVYECGPLCQCPPSCMNRVSQNGLRSRLEVFRSRETDWGVRSLDFIRAGEFICEISGILVPKRTAEVIEGGRLIYPNQFPSRWMEWGDLSKVIPGYQPPDTISLPELSFVVDVSKARNVASYLSHSCCPNVFVQHVLFDRDSKSYPHLMVFAMENIPPMRELSIDYGVGDGC